MTESGGKAGGAAATAKGVLILILLIIGAGAGGYFFGTYQKFAPIQTVPPGTPGAIDQATASQSSAVPAPATTLKKKYWLLSTGYDHIGFAITVNINGQSVARIFSPDRTVDITRYVKAGENQVTFDAKSLTDGMREHKGDGSYKITVHILSGNSVGQSGADELLTYTRNANEFDDHNDSFSFLAAE